MHIRKKGVRRTEEVFDVDGKRIEVVEEFTYLGCVVPEQMRGKRMVEVKAQAGSNTLSDWLRKCRDAAGEVRGRTFVRLMEMLVGSVLLYGQRGGVGEVNLSQYRGCKCERPGFSWEYCREVVPTI